MNELKLLDNINEIGYLLLKHGAEIYRIEESLKRMCESLGFQKVEVFAIPSYFTISLELKDGSLYNTSKRASPGRIHLDYLYELNRLVRRICNNDVPPENIQFEIDEILSNKLNHKKILMGYIIASSMFTIFFGGYIKEAILGGFIGMILYFALFNMERVKINIIVRTILSSMLLATIAIVSSKIGLIDNQQAVITGSLMLLVPGIAITNSLRDIISGDFISGISRMVEAILIAASIAMGVGIMMTLLRGL